jgi:hypothetical protein
MYLINSSFAPLASNSTKDFNGIYGGVSTPFEIGDARETSAEARVVMPSAAASISWPLARVSTFVDY